MDNDPLASIHAPDRLEVLQRLGLLDASTEVTFDRLTQMAVRLLRVPVALVSLLDADRQFFKGCTGLGEPWASCREIPLSHSFCKYTVTLGKPLIIADARVHPLVHTNPAITELSTIAYAGIPLIASNGLIFGTFCVIDTKPHNWTDDDIDTLNDLAIMTLTEIELRNEIRERRQVETELRESNAHTETILSSIPDVFMTVNANWEFTYVNPATAVFFSRSREQLIGKQVWEIHPELVDTIFHDTYNQVMREQTPAQLNRITKY